MKSLSALALCCLLALVHFNTGFAQYPNVKVNLPTSFNPEEVSIAINPANPQNLAMGANINYAYYSFDGGLSWTETNLTSSFGVWGDPCVIFDADGNLFYGHLSNPPGPAWLDEIVVQKSVNGGLSWNDGVAVGFNNFRDQDKEWLAADHTQSPYRNQLYMAWTEFDEYASPDPLDSTRILFSRSINAGTTWSLPLRISDRGGDCLDGDNTVEGAVPAVGPDGQVYVSWSGPLGIMFDKSLDGGLTFGSDIFVTDQPGGWAFDIPGIYRCNGMPITLCDVSNSPYRGTIYVVWSDQRNSAGDTDVFLVKSLDGGQSWSAPKRVNDDNPGRHQFFPWAAVDPVTGILYVAFYDRRNTGGTATDVYVARSTDGGENFVNFRVSETAFTPDPTVFFGDYMNVAAYNGKVYPAWMRLDGTLLSVWVALVDDTPFALEETAGGLPSGFELRQNYPNPFNAATRITFRLTRPGKAILTVHNVLGEMVRLQETKLLTPGEHSLVFNAGDLPSGAFYYTLASGSYRQSRKMLLLK